MNKNKNGIYFSCPNCGKHVLIDSPAWGKTVHGTCTCCSSRVEFMLEGKE